MAENDQLDDLASRDTLRDILADLATTPSVSQPSASSISQNPTWAFSPSSPWPSHPPSPLPRTSSAGRPIQQQRSASSGQIPASSGNDQLAAAQSTLFNSPNRSIFSSGPPTASMSVNAAHASLSSAGPSNATRPLSALTAPGTTSTRNRSNDSPVSSSRRPNMAVPEKDIDDPSSAPVPSPELPNTNTPIALTRLFASSDHVPGSLSRPNSYFRTSGGNPNGRALADTSSISGHLLNRGLLGGLHSDITVHAFGNSYALHRLLLDRAPFFSSALSGPWAESSAKDMTLHPEDIDSNITQAAFELALKRIYGCNLTVEEDREAIGLFATGCWLDMSDLVNSSVDSLLRQMHPSKLVPLIKTVTSNYYGKAGDRILSSAKAMLFREGWEMPYEYWDGIPGDIVREVIGGDAFYVSGEWERWYLTVRLLNRRLRARAIEAGLITGSGRYLQPRPSTIKFFAVRFDTVYRRNSVLGGRQVSEKDEAWVALYTAPDIAPLLVLLDEGIHYVHLRFEQLQQIRNQRDILGIPVMPEKVISNALWMSMELRQKVVNAQEADLELGLSQVAEDHSQDEDPLPEKVTMSAKGKQPEVPSHETKPVEMLSDSWDGNGKPRKFWIPTTDSSSILGGAPDAYVAANNNGAFNPTPHLSRLSASLEPSDVQWASDFMAAGGELGHTRTASTEQPQPARFSHYPPFRFSAEFPNPRTLKEKKRVYSQTVWYAGSMWNLYIQRVNTAKAQQLGIYLHRAKDKEGSEDLLAPATVDDRIGQLEREMLMRKNERRNRHWRSMAAASGGEADPEDETSASSGDLDTTLVPVDSESSTRTPGLGAFLRPDGLVKAHKTSQNPTSSLPLPTPSPFPFMLDADEEDDDLAKASKKFNVSALPPYVDGRPTIKTYFKIYSPSKAGRMLSVYESAPDRFNFSQSWGWKSSTMVLDDGITGYDGVAKGGKDGKLRYMVVIGNV